jgi:hypothetical protein
VEEDTIYELKLHVRFVRIHVLTVASMKFRVFWDVAPSSQVEETDISEVCTASIIRAIIHRPDDRGSMDL